MKKFSLLLFLLSFSISFAQKNIDTSYSKYFEANREIPFLHLNKTTFIVGEEVWFKAYVLNQKNEKLSDFTRNLYCFIYDEDGKLKDKKLLYVENGIAKGNFKIDSTFTKKNYFIKTATNWMRNFKEDASYKQKITILNPKELKNKKKEIVKNNHEVQLLPEGGNALENFDNNYGVIIKNQYNIGIQIKKGEVLDNENNLISTFKTNNFGLGNLSFYYKDNKSYTVKITLPDDKIIRKKISKAEKFGVSLQVENKATPFIRITIGTNNTTLNNLNGKQFKIYIHNTNTVLERTITFNKKENLYNLIIATNKLNKGINIITLLDDNNNPVAERLVFNYDKDKVANLKIDTLKKENDSLSILLTKEKTEDIVFLSASVLPKQTKAYNPSNSIISQFLLKPFVKGDIQNPAYYFTKTNRKKLIELDLLLLTQGWSKYDWKDVFYTPITYQYESENGITLYGVLNTKGKTKAKKVYLMVAGKDSLITKKVKDNLFSYKNLYLKDNARLDFISSNGSRTIKTKGYITQKNTLATNTINFKEKAFKNSDFNMDTDFSLSNIFDKNRVALDEISLKTKIEKPKFKPVWLNSVNRRVVKIGENYNGTYDVALYLRQLGYFIPTTVPGSQQTINIFRSAARSRSEVNVPFVIFLDNVLLRDGFDIIQDFRVPDFSEIHYGENEIFFYLNTEGRSSSTKSGKFLAYKLPLGFSESKKYYNPKYDTTSKSFEDFGAVYWKSDIEISSKKRSISLKTPILNQDKMILYLEGITSSGKLISIRKEIDSNLND
ncbi:MAG: hypothetical protein AB8B78_04715 [Polaribacter sp.]